MVLELGMGQTVAVIDSSGEGKRDIIGPAMLNSFCNNRAIGPSLTSYMLCDYFLYLMRTKEIKLGRRYSTTSGTIE